MKSIRLNSTIIFGLYCSGGAPFDLTTWPYLQDVPSKNLLSPFPGIEAWRTYTYTQQLVMSQGVDISIFPRDRDIENIHYAQ